MPIGVASPGAAVYINLCILEGQSEDLLNNIDNCWTYR